MGAKIPKEETTFEQAQSHFDLHSVRYKGMSISNGLCGEAAERENTHLDRWIYNTRQKAYL